MRFNTGWVALRAWLLCPDQSVRRPKPDSGGCSHMRQLTRRRVIHRPPQGERQDTGLYRVLGADNLRLGNERSSIRSPRPLIRLHRGKAPTMLTPPNTQGVRRCRGRSLSASVVCARRSRRRSPVGRGVMARQGWRVGHYFEAFVQRAKLQSQFSAVFGSTCLNQFEVN